MTKRLFTVLISLAIAFQSVMSLADVDQQHYSEAQHHEYLHDVASWSPESPDSQCSRLNVILPREGGGLSQNLLGTHKSRADLYTQDLE